MSCKKLLRLRPLDCRYVSFLWGHAKVTVRQGTCFTVRCELSIGHRLGSSGLDSRCGKTSFGAHCVSSAVRSAEVRAAWRCSSMYKKSSNCPYTYWAEGSVQWQAVVKTVMSQSSSQRLPYSQKYNNNIFNCKWAVTRWQWLLCVYINMK
jgi:hypothetical protein